MVWTPARHREYLAVTILVPLFRSFIQLKILFKRVLPFRSGNHKASSLRLHIIASQRVLVADVKLAAGHDRMRPTGFAKVGDGKAPLLFVACRRRFGQPD